MVSSSFIKRDSLRDWVRHLCQTCLKRKYNLRSYFNKIEKGYFVFIISDNQSLFLTLTFTLKWTKIKNKTRTIVMIFQMVNLPFISSKIPTTPAYVFYISQFIRYSRACVQTLIFWTEFSCWRKSYLNIILLFLLW